VTSAAFVSVELEERLGQIRAALTSEEWDAAYQAGRKMTIEDALLPARSGASLTSPPDGVLARAMSLPGLGTGDVERRARAGLRIAVQTTRSGPPGRLLVAAWLLVSASQQNAPTIPAIVVYSHQRHCFAQPASSSSAERRAGKEGVMTVASGLGGGSFGKRRVIYVAAVLALALAATTLAAAGSFAVPARGSASQMAARHHYHNGVFGQAAKQFCRSTQKYTASHRIRTEIVRSTDKWHNTIHSRYRKFTQCTARQMTNTVWCTTKRVDGVSRMCITPRPQAGGSSPCRRPKLDVRGVYHPKTGILRITCVNQS
jgi:hypothetical protein